VYRRFQSIPSKVGIAGKLFLRSRFLLFWDVCSVVFKAKQRKRSDVVPRTANYSIFSINVSEWFLCPGGSWHVSTLARRNVCKSACQHIARRHVGTSAHRTWHSGQVSTLTCRYVLFISSSAHGLMLTERYSVTSDIVSFCLTSCKS